MKLSLKKAVAEVIGLKYFVPFGVDADTWKYRGKAGSSVDLDLDRFSKVQLNDLEKVLKTKEKIRGVGVLLKDLATYREALTNAKGAKPRTVRHFYSILQKFLLSVPSHWIYRKHGATLDSDDLDEEETAGVISNETIDQSADTWLAYYVNRIEYEPAVEHGERRHPAYVQVSLLYEQYGGGKSSSVNFYEADCRGMNVVAALAGKGFYPETPELQKTYKQTIKRFGEVAPQIGHQFLAIGAGMDDPDGNPSGRDTSWYWRQQHEIDMVRNGEPTRCVIDVFYEEGNTRRETARDPNPWYWKNLTKRPSDFDDEAVGPDAEAAEAALAELPDDDDTDDQRPLIEIPVHPWLVVFDLAKHLRLRVHVNQLTEYRYDPGMADKLILSVARKTLIKLLIDAKASAFKDIVKGKAGGSVVLLTGPPGVGKTLTAEVYAESEGRALYSIQCSQLGTDPDTIEDALLKVFARARRWNAVMLIDEADVYVHERGNDLQQNAIVGVFLRVLEYQSSVLFLTTNRPEDVDDAIASRCVARLDYEIPTPEEQEKIWSILLVGCATAKMTPATIKTIVACNPELSGRDIKNLLKLAQVMSPTEISVGTVEFVKQFKPTGKRERLERISV